MAELLLKIGTVGPDPAYQDGDIVFAPNNRRISQVHLEHHCHLDNFGFEVDRRRPLGTLAQFFREAVCQYKFERVSDFVLVRTNLWTGEREELSDKENQNGECINVPLFIARQIGHDGHGIFGTPGAEVWYGGEQDYDAKTLDDIWPRVSDELGVKREDYGKWPFSDHELKHFLALKTDDFDDTKAATMVASVYDDKEALVKKRARMTSWKTLDLGVTASAVESKTTTVDTRDTKSFLTATVVAAKAVAPTEVVK